MPGTHAAFNNVRRDRVKEKALSLTKHQHREAKLTRQTTSLGAQFAIAAVAHGALHTTEAAEPTLSWRVCNWRCLLLSRAALTNRRMRLGCGRHATERGVEHADAN